MSSSAASGTGTPPILRDARPRDLESLWRLDQVCFEPDIAYSRRQLSRFLELPGAICVVAETGAELCGFALAYSEPADLAHVVTLDVHPNFRRRGLGRSLIESVLARAAAGGAKSAVLEVDVRNAGAIQFYRQLGFRRSGRLADYYGPGRDAFEMASELTPARLRGADGSPRVRRSR